MRIFRYGCGLCLLAAVFGLLALTPAGAADEVRITPSLRYVELKINGQTIAIERNQDQEARLTGDFTKTSRACPPFCIHPMEAAPGVETVGELELIDFLQDRVEIGRGLLVDARVPSWFEKAAIPGAVNIPFTVLEEKNNPYLDKILAALGAREIVADVWDFTDAMELVLYCNGPWCDQSPRAIRNLISVGYPAEKLFYYRGGMQNWLLMGLSTVPGGQKAVASQ